MSRPVRIALGALISAACAVGSGAATGASTVTRPCQPRVIDGVLPPWARAGFSDPRPRMDYALGRADRIVAILWADPLLSPPPRDHNNKILWVSHRAPRAGSPLRISAQLMVGDRAIGTPVARTVPGAPGPSIIDLPHPGCWRLTLRWSGRVDSLDLRYQPRPTPPAAVARSRSGAA